MKWIKIWTEEVVKGTTFSELDAASRGVWFSLLALAGIDGSGIIQAGVGRGYSVPVLSEILNIPSEILSDSLEKLQRFFKIKILNHGEIEIINWSKYQDEYSRQKPYRNTRQEIQEKKKRLQAQLHKQLQPKLQHKLPADIDKDKDKEKTTQDKPVGVDSSPLGVKAEATTKTFTPLQKVVLYYKVLKGHERDDASWDKLNFARCSKSAKLLIEYLGDEEVAMDCTDWVNEELGKKGLEWTLETVVKRAGDFKIAKANNIGGVR